MRWRLADVSDATPPRYEIESIWESEDRTSYAEVTTLPGRNLTPGHRYRVRADYLRGLRFSMVRIEEWGGDF